MIRLEEIGRDYPSGDRQLTVLDDINLQINRDDFVAVTGPSGSGKSTFLALLAGLDRPTRGKLWIDGEEITTLSEDHLSLLRGRKIGFVFQSFQLIPTLTALENVRVPAELQGNFSLAAEANEALKGVGLAERAHHYPSQLSGGEMQRVAIARASITRPSILLADEPTGNLDSANGQLVMDLLVQLNRNSTLVLVTHNRQLAALADYEVQLEDGRIDKIVPHRQRQKKSRL